MDKIIRPKHEGMYPDRAIDCRKAMDAALGEFLDLAGNAGWSIPETLDAIEGVLPDRRAAYFADPDPAEG